MTDQETITVADVSDGPGGTSDEEPGDPVSLPVVELLTGRGFITGKSGSGKSNTASVIIERLLDNGLAVLIVDTDGEYYGLKEEYEILHAGADEECDIQVSPEHAEKLAELALGQNVPIILDVSGYLDEADAEEMLLETARSLFAKEKKLKKPFLMLVEECHEYIPEKGGMGEAGKMLIKVGKRGRKHGLGIVGISQRPADVKKDYITQCDWLVWHRLTWNNDTKVVGRILGTEYADAIEDMGNGEGFLMTDWSENLRRVQFHRKQTFDAGATPGLDDFERPELKSVSGNLVSELTDISDEKAHRESELADLRQELDKKRQRINQLERELEDAQDLSRMADKFAQALLHKAEAPYRRGPADAGPAPAEQSDLYDYEPDANESGTDPGEPTDADEDADVPPDPAPYPGMDDPLAVDGPAAVEDADEGRADDAARGAADHGDVGAEEGVDDAAATLDSVSDDPAAEEDGDESPASPRATVEDVQFAVEDAMRFAAEHVDFGTREAVIEELRERVEELEGLSLAMLRHYREAGEDTAVDAHVAAGGSGDRHLAYSRNRALRQRSLVRHVGRGRYAYAVPDLIREAYADRLGDDEFAEMVTAVESAFLDPREFDRSTAADRDAAATEGDD